jgi:alpha-1,3-mannosyl-glycoprotein beta-1,2-N-acetylglucosaminyltransferase
MSLQTDDETSGYFCFAPLWTHNHSFSLTLFQVRYTDFFSQGLQAAVRANTAEDVVQRRALSSDVLLEYRDEQHFKLIANQLGIFDEWKVCRSCICLLEFSMFKDVFHLPVTVWQDGVPRTAYVGVVTIRFHGSHRVYIIGPNSKPLLAHKPAFS